MFASESRGGADQARIIMSNQLDRNIRHSPLEPSLGDEAIAKAGADEVVRDAVSEAAANHHGLSAVGEREIAGDRAQAQAEAIERRSRK
jgi:hypothetical protein